MDLCDNPIKWRINLILSQLRGLGFERQFQTFFVFQRFGLLGFRLFDFKVVLTNFIVVERLGLLDVRFHTLFQVQVGFFQRDHSKINLHE